jgi:phosphate-selective porin OprO/OprP
MHKPILTLSLALVAATSFAGPPKPAADVQKEKSIYDTIWDSLTLYDNKDGVFMNRFRITGRAHFDEYALGSNQGSDQDWVVRRLRIGGKATFFKNLDVHVEADFNPQNLGGALYVADPAYQKLTDAYVSWKFSDAIKLTVGKQSVKFTLDGGTSSNELITIDRNNLTNNLWFTTEYITGASLGGKIGEWQYNTGIFSGGSIYQAQSQFAESSKEFGDFDGGQFWLGSVGYDFARKLGVKKALLRADVVYNQPDTNSNATKNFSWIESLNFQYDAGRWGFSTDLSYGDGSLGQSGVFGFVVMPWFNITDKLQVVGRYTYMTSDDPNGVSFNRYENVQAVNYNKDGSVKTNKYGKVSGQRGDEYNEVYLGLSYYLYGHKLKVQTGFDYVWMDGTQEGGGTYSGWGFTTGLRVSW